MLKASYLRSEWRDALTVEMSDVLIITGRQSADAVERIKRLVWLLILERMTGMETKSKGECIERAIDSLLELQERSVDAVSWLEKSKAFVPDESKTVQDLKAALAKSIERETELENALALSEDSRDDLKASLRKALQREGELRGKLTAYLEREQALLTYVTSLTSVIAKAGSHLDEMRSISRAPIAVEGDPLPTLHHPSPHLDQDKFKHTGIFPVAEEDKARQGLNNPVEACCQNYEECNKQCVPLANYWRNRAKEAEKKGMEHKWNMQWVIPDVTCTADPVRPRPLI